ncbi:MAG: dihydrolipoyllysine-residue acetyltransferase [Gammaproteobacteria bacterium]|nr:dihydrolipoyllysine-residue acetyltransferase [Gammaproteobacteria bacterium]
MASSIDIIVPDLGDFDKVEIIEVLVGSGDRVAREDGLITLETDKASFDVPAPDDGVVESLTVGVGDSVSTGDVIGTMSVANEAEPQTQTDAAPAEDQTSKPAQEQQTSGGNQTLVVPDIGDFDEVDVIEVHIGIGDEVSVEDPLVTLETDKASMDVPAVAAGKVEMVLVKVGDKVAAGTELAVIDAVAGSSLKKPTAAAAPQKPESAPEKDPRREPAPSKPSPAPAAATLPPVEEAGFSKAHASPSVRKLARELGVNLAQVKGSGAKSRILHEDVKAFVKSIMTGQAAAPAGGGLPKTPSIDFTKFGDVESRALTRIQKISGPRLQASWINLPHVTQHDQADITDLEAMRQKLKGPAKERGIGLTPLAFVMKACVAALEEYPTVNASLADDGQSLILKKYCHLGFAADTDQGLVVPVIRDADKKDVYEIAAELGRLSALAREGKLKTDNLQGATFTISSLGGIGGTAFTPIINAPEVAILGVSRSTMQPVWNGSEFEPRLMLPLSLSYDHRVVDGAQAVRFTTFLGQKLTDVDGLLRAIP